MKANRSKTGILFTLAAVAAVSGCVKPFTPPPPPPPAPAPPPPKPLPKPPTDWRDAPQTPGTWIWSNTAGRSTATYGVLGAAPQARLTCDKSAGAVLLARQGSAPMPVPMQVSTTALTRPLMSDPARGTQGWVVTAMPVRDPLLDAMAFSRGRFALETAGLPTLYLPSWPELSRVIEDCR